MSLHPGDAGLEVYGAGDDPLAALSGSIPGVPGEDYPILAEVPETAFSCEGQVDGGEFIIRQLRPDTKQPEHREIHPTT